MTEWESVHIGDVADVSVGFAFKSAQFSLIPPGLRLVRGDNVKRGTLEWGATTRYWSDWSPALERYLLRKGDVVVGMDGSRLGENFAVISDEDLPALLVQRVACLRNRAALDQGFLRYLICNPLFTAYVKAVHTGTSIPHISSRQIGEYAVRLPSLAEQRAIARVLRSLDDKIDSNRRLATVLEKVAKADFRARFVAFVGVEEFEESEMGPIPRGWRAGALTDLGRFVNGKAFTKEATGHGRPILRIKELNNGVQDGTPCSDIEVADDHLARHHDILFAWSGSLGVYRWSGPEALINQHIFKVIPDAYPAWFVYQWICWHMDAFRAIARDKATTMGHIQRRHLSEARVAVPDPDRMAAVNDLVNPVDAQVGLLASEITTLIAIRDELLPKLISGQIRVPDTHDPEEVIGPSAERLVAATL